MGLGIKGLADSISGAVGFFGALFGSSSKAQQTAIPEDSNILAQIERGNWAKSLPYSFAVVDIENSEISDKTGFGVFELPISPTAITQDENFAHTIKPTQGGTIVQHSGNKYKDLTIAGTTGIHPFRGAGGVLKTTGLAIGQSDDLQHSSGFEVFLLLRNWFRAYYENKKLNPSKSKNLRLVFQNFKDGEFLIVELIKFSMGRTGDRGFLYDYNMSFKVLAPITFKEKKLDIFEQIDAAYDTALDAIDAARGIFLVTQGIIRQVESNVDSLIFEPMRRIALATKAFLGVGTVAADAAHRTLRKFDTFGSTFKLYAGIKEQQDAAKTGAAIDPRLQNFKLPVNLEQGVKTSGINILLDDESGVLLAIPSTDLSPKIQAEMELEKEDALKIPREFYETVRDELVRVRDNATDSFNLGDSTFDDQFDRVVTLEADTGKTPTDEEFEVLYGFNQAIRGINLILSQTDLFKSPYEQRITNVQDNFDDDLGLIVEAAVREIILPSNTTLERLALNELGTSKRWIEIAELNDLKPPYIIQDKVEAANTLNVLAPGQQIIVPESVVSGFSNVVTNKELTINQELTELERSLGIDLKLTAEFDLELTNQGDIKLITAGANAGQAIVLKLLYEKGDLLKHPELGIGAIIGSKVTSPLTMFRSAIVSTLQADPRFESINRLELRRENNELRMSFEVKLKNVDIPIPIDLKL